MSKQREPWQLPPVHVRDVPRENDDRLLDWLAHYEAGWSLAAIARKWGVSYQLVQAQIRGVMDVLNTEPAHSRLTHQVSLPKMDEYRP